MWPDYLTPRPELALRPWARRWLMGRVICGAYTIHAPYGVAAL